MSLKCNHTKYSYVFVFFFIDFKISNHFFILFLEIAGVAGNPRTLPGVSTFYRIFCFPEISKKNRQIWQEVDEKEVAWKNTPSRRHTYSSSRFSSSMNIPGPAAELGAPPADAAVPPRDASPTPPPVVEERKLERLHADP